MVETSLRSVETRDAVLFWSRGGERRGGKSLLTWLLVWVGNDINDILRRVEVIVKVLVVVDEMLEFLGESLPRNWGFVCFFGRIVLFAIPGHYGCEWETNSN